MESKGGPDGDAPPSGAKELKSGYNQTYIIMSNEGTSASSEGNDVYFRWVGTDRMSYLQFNFLFMLLFFHIIIVLFFALFFVVVDYKMLINTILYISIPHTFLISII